MKDPPLLKHKTCFEHWTWALDLMGFPGPSGEFSETLQPARPAGRRALDLRRLERPALAALSRRLSDADVEGLEGGDRGRKTKKQFLIASCY